EVALQLALSRQLARIESPLYLDNRIQRLADMLKPLLPPLADQVTEPYTRLKVLANGFRCDNEEVYMLTAIEEEEIETFSIPNEHYEDMLNTLQPTLTEGLTHTNHKFSELWIFGNVPHIFSDIIIFQYDIIAD
ncbi:23568_t:CDS:2, partial [Gigaspora rosea]